MTRNNNSSFFSGITSGLTSTFSALSNSSTKGVSLSSISAARSDANLANSLNQNFASYIQTNFSTLDKDGDGIISSVEISNLTNQISQQGLTAAQLSQLGAASGLSASALEQVLEHFSEIDANNDGKVTSSEINAYKIGSAAEKKKSEFRMRAAADQSMFYGSEGEIDTSSLLDYKYMNSNNTNS